MINQSIQVMINQSIQAMINQSIQVIASDMLTPSGNFGLQGHGSAQERSFEFWGVMKILWWWFEIISWGAESGAKSFPKMLKQ